MTADEALEDVALRVAQAMLDCGMLEREAVRAAEIVTSGDLAALNGSAIADVIERDSTHYALLVEGTDTESQRMLAYAERHRGASVSRVLLLDIVGAIWAKTWGSLGTTSGPESEAM